MKSQNYGHPNYSLENICFEDSLLELFAKNGQLTREMIEDISDTEKILERINDKKKQHSGIFSVVKDFNALLGGIEEDNDGRIISATAIRFDLFGKMNVTAAHLDISRDSVLDDQLAIGTIKSNPFHDW